MIYESIHYLLKINYKIKIFVMLTQKTDNNLMIFFSLEIPHKNQDQLNYFYNFSILYFSLFHHDLFRI